MSFGWLGTFRQGSWRAFRKFILEERRDIEARIAVIEAELSRIGQVTVTYAREVEGDADNQAVTEERTGIFVTQGSSLEKLFWAYISMGGNPFDISLFLTPDATVVFSDNDGETRERGSQPGEGVVSPQDGVYSVGATYEGGFLNIKKYVPARTGGRVTLEDQRVAGQVLQARRPHNQAIRYKRNDIEWRIIKLCDLREQLLHELEELSLAASGEVVAAPSRDEGQFENVLSVASIVAAIDRVFYTTVDNGGANFAEPNEEALRRFPNLLEDISPDEDNTAL